MSMSPEITLMHETARNIQEGLRGATDVWRHEGLKRGVEFVLDHLSRRESGLWLLEQASGGSIVDDRLATSIGGLALEGPMGVAPGWDKPGRTMAAWHAMGARHGTPGAVVFWGQPGNRMPRLHTFTRYIGDHGNEVSLNSYGFYAPRREKVIYNLERQREAGLVGKENGMPIIVQVTLNKEMYDEEHKDHIPHWLAATIKAVLPVADGISLGLSSPNTKGMRIAQDDEKFVVNCVKVALDVADGKPVVYKGDADGGEPRFDIYCRLIDEFGIIMELINTTGKREIKAKYGVENLPGGLAGGDPDYQQMAVDAVRYVYEQTGGEIIGVGGIGVGRTGQAIRLLRAGARALGVNTGIRKRGAKIMTSTEREIIDHLDTLPPGRDTLQHVIGADTKRGATAA